MIFSLLYIEMTAMFINLFELKYEKNINSLEMYLVVLFYEQYFSKSNGIAFDHSTAA